MERAFVQVDDGSLAPQNAGLIRRPLSFDLVTAFVKKTKRIDERMLLHDQVGVAHGTRPSVVLEQRGHHHAFHGDNGDAVLFQLRCHALP
jgi:hypothetical protein